MSPRLFDPLALRGVVFRNRLWISPMCQYAVEARDGVATHWHLVHLGSLARGGAGAVFAEATAVVPEGRISSRDLGLWNDEQRDALATVVDFVRSQGAVAGIQLAHAGRKASAWPPWGAGGRTGSVEVADGGWETYGPSPIAFPGMRLPLELDPTGIDEVVTAFVASARRAVDAGFELVELHGAHGYLLHSFLSPLSNHRDDEYGGTLENRARLLLDVVDAVRAEVGESVVLSVRLSATDWTEGGVTLDDTVQVAGWLRERGVDLVDVSSGGNVPAEIPVGPGYQTRFASAVREGAKVPTAAVGLITDPGQAEHVVATGQADVVLIGRAALRDPHFPTRAAVELGAAEVPVPGQYERAYRGLPRR